MKGMSSQEIHENMKGTLGKDYSPCTDVKNWAEEFKIGRTSNKGASWSGRAMDVTNDLQIDHIHNTIMNDRRITFQHIYNTVGISFGSVQSIFIMIST